MNNMNYNTAGYFNGYSSLDYGGHFNGWYGHHDRYEVGGIGRGGNRFGVNRSVEMHECYVLFFFSNLLKNILLYFNINRYQTLAIGCRTGNGRDIEYGDGSGRRTRCRRSGLREVMVCH